MRILWITALAIAFAACASKPAPEETNPADASAEAPAGQPAAGFVAHVDEASGMAVIRTSAVFEVGTVLRVECGRSAVGILRVGSTGEGMVAGLVESGAVAAGSCVLTPIRR
jgi:hypothetical protein